MLSVVDEKLESVYRQAAMIDKQRVKKEPRLACSLFRFVGMVCENGESLPDKVGKNGAAPRVGTNGGVVLERISQVRECDEEGACHYMIEKGQPLYVAEPSLLLLPVAAVRHLPFHAERDLSIDVGNMVLQMLWLRSMVVSRKRRSGKMEERTF